MSTIALRPAFARNLRHALLARGTTQERFARELDSATRTVSYWCNGQTQPSRKYLALIADALAVSPGWLFDEHGYGHDGQECPKDDS